MAATRANPRLQVGSAPWISNERSSTFQVVESEAEEFTFSARNEIDWLNEHMAEIFSENQVYDRPAPRWPMNADSVNAGMSLKYSKPRASYGARLQELQEK
jgi:hypothetical protein